MSGSALDNVIYYVRLSDLCHKAYADYAAGAISGMAYNKIYAVCMDYAYPKLILKSEVSFM